MVWLGRIGFGTFWVWFGYAGVLVQVVVGGFLVRRRAVELMTLLSAQSGDDAAVAGAARRLRNIQMTYLILFAIVIAYRWNGDQAYALADARCDWYSRHLSTPQ
jgi:uncharacterized membrane protein (DUF4010 family)